MHTCDECPIPVFERRGVQLIFRQRHHGKNHVTIVSLLELLEEVEAEAGSLAKSEIA
jgi:hypothetical protein